MMHYERENEEFQTAGGLRGDAEARRWELYRLALDKLEFQMDNLGEAGATSRIEALCEIIRTLGSRR